MNWTKGEWYKRRNGGMARYKGVSYEMLVFYHSDLIDGFRFDGCLVHHLDGRMMSLPKDRDVVAPFDIIQNDNHIRSGLCDFGQYQPLFLRSSKRH